MRHTFYWYDYETTGTDPAADRVIQFAGIRTNLDLEPIDEPLNLYCYPGDDVLPVPDAILVTGILMSDLERTGLRETDFVERIHREFARPGTCVCGFNSIRFDDEFTRHLLYRNFLDPYAREWQNDNSRWDVIDMFRMAHALRPAGIEWPVNEDGHPVFRLEALTEANHVPHIAAHDAVSDVMATIELTRKLKEVQPRLYEYLYNLRRKQDVIAQLYPLGKAALLHVSSMYPASRNCLAVVLPLCSHPTNPNGVICYDLQYDPSELLSMGPSELHSRLFTSTEELGEDTERIHLKTIHVNRCPAVAPLATLRTEDATRLDIDVAACEANMRRLQSASGVVETIQEAYSQTTFPKTDDPDFMLYQGDFFSNNDRGLMLALRELPVDGLARVPGTFDDPRVDEMIFRYRARNYPDTLSDEEKRRWDEFRHEKWAHGDAVRAALARIEELTAEHGEKACLADLRTWLERRMEMLRAYETGH